MGGGTGGIPLDVATLEGTEFPWKGPREGGEVGSSCLLLWGLGAAGKEGVLLKIPFIFFLNTRFIFLVCAS